jgi:hypothetical protein
MVIFFQVGDKVRVKTNSSSVWICKERKNSIGEIVSVLSNLSKTEQWCRVKFGLSMFDYEDVGSWRLERV